MKFFKQTLSILLSGILVVLPLPAELIQVDGTTSTNLDTARNGVTVVNIANPNSKGLSHNKFKKYSVGKKGVILNNSKNTSVNTQLSGYIFGNANLGTNAKVILNEVTSTARTYLNGYTEVAGKRADLVIANPNGITINGAGFINTSNVSFSTGKPIITNGEISSYNIQGGDIAIEGQGLNTLDTDSANIYTKYLHLNAKIYAKKLNITLGSQTPNTNTLLLDSSVLGGMYANAISLVGTNAGVGVNLPPEVLASSGDIVITTQGNIELQTLQDLNNINIQAKDVTSNALVVSGNDLTITSDNLTNNETLFAVNDMYLYTKNKLSNLEDSNILVVNDLTIAKNALNEKTQIFLNDRGTIETLDGDINIYAQSFTNTGNEATLGEKTTGSSYIELIKRGENLFTNTIEFVYEGIRFEKKPTLKHIGDVKESLKNEGKYTTSVVYHWSYPNGAEARLVCNPYTGGNCQPPTPSPYVFDNAEVGLYVNGIFYSKSEFTYSININSETTFHYKDRSKLAYVDDGTGAANEYELLYGLRDSIIYHYKDSDVLSRLKKVYKDKYGLNVVEILPQGNFYNRETVYRISLQSFPKEVKRRLTNTISEDYFIAAPDKFARLASGANLNLNVDNLKNYYSEISSVNDINFLNPTGDINNLSEVLYRHNTQTGQYKYVKKEGGMFHSTKYDWASLPTRKSSAVFSQLYATIQAGGDINGVAANVNNGYTKNKILPSTTQLDDSNNVVTLTKQDASTVSLNIPKNNYGVYTKVTDPNSNFLIERNPKFTLYKNFISSQYLMQRIRHNASATSKRLGDGMYENSIIRESIFKQTGRRFLNKNIVSDNAQFKYLMDNAIQASKDLELANGITLTTAQLNALTTDIVWMEEQIVEGEKVLVPVVYIANANNYKLEGSKIIAGKSINFNVATLNNAGKIETGEDLNILASDSIRNVNAQMTSDEDINLVAKNDIINTSANIQVKNINLIAIDGDILNQRYTKNVSYGTRGGKDNQVLLGKASNIIATDTLNMNAAENITIQGSNVKGKNVSLEAKNVKIITTIDKKDFYAGDSNAYVKKKLVNHIASNIEADTLSIKARDSINITGSKIKVNDTLTLNAKKDINVLAAINVDSIDMQSRSKRSMGRSKRNIDIVHKESVVSTSIDAKNIRMLAQGDITLEAANLNAEEEKIAYAGGNLNILAKDYKEEELHHSKSSSFGGLSKSEYKYEKKNQKVKSTEITAKNMILDAKQITILASKIKADKIELTADILNLISSKENLYESEFEIDNGGLTVTITTDGKITQKIIPATIEVNDKLVFNKKDITEQLEGDNLIKILSSQGNFSDEQINLIKQEINNDEWHTSKTTISAIGAIIVQVIVTVLTWGAGTAETVAATQAAAQAGTQAAIQAAAQAVVAAAATQLVTAAITGNKIKIDFSSIVKGAVTAGVLSYANGLVDVSKFGLEGASQQIAQKAVDTTIRTGVQSSVYGTDFKDSLVANLAVATTDYLAKEAFSAVGGVSMNEDVIEQNPLFEDGGLAKVALHTVTGAAIAEITGGDVLAGALSAGTRELISPLTADSSNRDQLLVSQLTGTIVGGIVDGEAGVKTGLTIATAGELYNRQLHQDEIRFLKDSENIEAFAKYYQDYTGESISIEDAQKVLAQGGISLVDKSSNDKVANDSRVQEARDFILENYTDKSAIFYKDENGKLVGTQGFNPSKSEYEDRYANLGGFIDNKDFYKKNLNLGNGEGASAGDYVNGTVQSLKDLGNALIDNPLDTAKAVGEGVVDSVLSPIDTLTQTGADARTLEEQAQLDTLLGDDKSAAEHRGEAYGGLVAGVIGGVAIKGVTKGIEKAKVDNINGDVDVPKLKFGDDDLVYGPSANNELNNFKNNNGGQLVGDLGNEKFDIETAQGQMSWTDFSIYKLNETVANGNNIHFDLTNVKDIDGTFKNTGEYANTVTSKELRYIRDNWERLEDNIKFYQNNKQVKELPWEK